MIYFYDEATRKSDGERAVYMRFEIVHNDVWKSRNNYEEIVDFIDRWAKQDSLYKYMRSETTNLYMVRDYSCNNFEILKLWDYIIIDRDWKIFVRDESAFKISYDKFVPDKIDFVFFNW